jgi:hypothetical protein
MSLTFSNMPRTYYVVDPAYMVFLTLYPTRPHHRRLMLTLAHLVRAWEWASSVGCRSGPHVYERQCLATTEPLQNLIITINSYENESTGAQGATNPDSHVPLNTNLLNKTFFMPIKIFPKLSTLKSISLNKTSKQLYLAVANHNT